MANDKVEAVVSLTIAGKAVQVGDRIAVANPSDESVVGHCPVATPADVESAVAAAKSAFPAWSSKSWAERQALISACADAIEAHAEEIAILESWDTGQAYRFMSKAAVRAAENFRFFADRVIEARDGRNMPTPDHWNVSTRVPIGPVGIITPWNTPFMLSTWKIAPRNTSTSAGSAPGTACFRPRSSVARATSAW